MTKVKWLSKLNERKSTTSNRPPLNTEEIYDPRLNWCFLTINIKWIEILKLFIESKESFAAFFYFTFFLNLSIYLLPWHIIFETVSSESLGRRKVRNKNCRIVPTSCTQQCWMLISHRGFLSINWLCVTMEKDTNKQNMGRENEDEEQNWQSSWAYCELASDHQFYDNHHFNWETICNVKIKFFTSLG